MVWKELREEISNGTYLQMLTSTQSVMDRLAHFYHWKDYQALEQAVWITEDHMNEVDFREIKKWSALEGFSKKYYQFVKRLKKDTTI